MQLSCQWESKAIKCKNYIASMPQVHWLPANRKTIKIPDWLGKWPVRPQRKTNSRVNKSFWTCNDKNDKWALLPPNLPLSVTRRGQRPKPGLLTGFVCWRQELCQPGWLDAWRSSLRSSLLRENLIQLVWVSLKSWPRQVTESTHCPPS